MIRECNNSNGPEGKLLELIKVGKVLQKKPLVLAMGLDEFCSHNGLFWLPAILVKILLHWHFHKNERKPRLLNTN